MNYKEDMNFNSAPLIPFPIYLLQLLQKYRSDVGFISTVFVYDIVYQAKIWQTIKDL